MPIYNEDGSEFNTPIDEDYDALIPKNCIPGGRDPYMCIFCGKCPLGDNFVPTAEQKVIIDRHDALIEAYIKEHNPTKGLEGITVPINAE